MTLDSNRQPAGIPVGGQFSARGREESEVVLESHRTAFAGYEMRSYRSSGQGVEGEIWTARIFLDGRPVLAVTDEGNGERLRLTPIDVQPNEKYSDAEDRFERQARVFFPTDEPISPFNGQADFLADALKFSSLLDRAGKRRGQTRAEVVDEHIAGGEILEAEREFFVNPDSFPRCD